MKNIKKETIDNYLDLIESTNKFAIDNKIDFLLQAGKCVACMNNFEELLAIANELGDCNIETTIFAKGNDEQFSHISQFTYRNFEFYHLIERK
ncbi:MAG: hypothetical protein BV456_03510 [Thermoplasmata archaeon M8B2D]|nr:MAG: hypothetical protein BV456_03510 [Thermoplasmata archaeon M8B2D]